ncbi:MAG: fatty acid desaturase, partial [Gammaproteobacteria bacterium]|nr:fatty acid desaturase [Gammaproteobacteria bacterium]
TALVLIALLAGSFLAADLVLRAAQARAAEAPLMAALAWVAVGLFATFDVLLLIGMGVLAHDAVHRVLFRSSFWNEFWACVLSALALIPFYANRQFHLTHHSAAHQPGRDPENAMHNHGFLFAATAGSVIALIEQYRYLLRNLARVTEPRYAGRAILDLICVGSALWIYFGLVPLLGLSLAATILPMLAVFPFVFSWRALSDHYGVPAIERAVRKGDVEEIDAEAWHHDRARRQREVTGWVVLTSPWLEWLWSHVNYHEVHHKYPWLSHVYLKPVFTATRDSQPYLVVNGYWRSLLNLRRLHYYGARAPLRRFLSTPEW